MKKAAVILITFIFSCSTYCIASLSDSDKRDILARLDALLEAAEKEATNNRTSALRELRNASSTPSNAISFYESCVQQVQFEESEKSQSDFRTWRRNNESKHRDSTFRRALQIQIQWLELTLQAAEKDADRVALAESAQRILNDLFDTSTDFSAYRDVLNKSVLESVMARALRINTIKVERWPLHPLDVTQVYEQILLPPLRKSRDIRALRETWQKRLQHQELIASVWADPKRPQLQKFLVEDRPTLIWQMHRDLFLAGDLRNSARSMATHIEQNITHPQAMSWLSELRVLIDQASVE